MSAGVFAEEPTFISTNEGGRLLDVRFEHSNLLWPWSGFLALYIRVSPEGATFKVQLPLSHIPYPAAALAEHKRVKKNNTIHMDCKMLLCRLLHAGLCLMQHHFNTSLIQQ